MKVLLIIAAVIALILMIPLKARVIYDGELTIRASVCGVKITVLPKKKKPVRLSDWTKKAVLKREEKEKRKAEKKRLSDERKKARADAKKKKEEKEEKPSIDAGEGHKKPGRGFGFYMKFVRVGVRVVKKLIKKLRRNIDIDIYRLWIKVASADAESTARTYGIISGGVCHALAFLGEKGHVRYHAPKGYDAVYVEADFTAEKLDFIVDVEIGSHIGRLLGIVNGVIGSAIAGLIKEFLFSKEK